MNRKRVNVIKTSALFASLWGTLIVFWALVARHSLWILAGVCVFACVATMAVYFSCNRTIIRAMEARGVTEFEQPVMHRLVRELSTAAQLPMPRLYVSPAPAPNAFTAGRNPKSAVVCCTQGLLDTMSERELRAILAHEIVHIRNRDILSASVAAVLSGILSGLIGPLFVLFPDGDRGNTRLRIGLAILVAPLMVTFIQLAISRSNELRADHDAAQLTGDPLGLALALRKLDRGTQSLPMPRTSRFRAVSHLMIVQPFRATPIALLGSHPPIAGRIARLEQAALDSW